MTRIYLYEHITAQSIGHDPASTEHSLFVEGRAMFRAILEDFAAIPGVEVSVGSPGEFAERAAVADWSFVIAPETDGVLLQLAAEVQRVGGRLLGPSLAAITLTSDKYSLFQHWRKHGVPTPETALSPERPNCWPCVVKRRDGAGSEGMKLVLSAAKYDTLPGPWIAQQYCPGIPVSMAFLIGPRETVALPPTFQLISSDGQFRYGGGLLPIAPLLASRCERLARQAIADVPGLLGYIGVDMILGDAEDGSGDVALEINPRLTTSYVGLRAYLRGSIAAMMLEIANGITSQTQLSQRGRLSFNSAGKTEKHPAYDFWNVPSDYFSISSFFSKTKCYISYSSE